MSKNEICVYHSGVFFKLQNMPKLVFSDPTGGAYDALPDPLVGWGGGHPLPIPFPPRRLRHLDLSRRSVVWPRLVWPSGQKGWTPMVYYIL